MKLNNIFISVGLVLACTSATVFAATEPAPYTGVPTTGEIQFKGELVNSACGLAASSSPVIVDFVQIPVSALKNGKKAGNVQKNIELQDCDISVAKTATITYMPNTQDVANPNLAAMLGTAKGAGIGLIDNAGQDVKWGEASAKVNLKNGKSVIPFTAFIQAETASSVVEPGEFTSQINFQIDYQ